MAVLNDWQKLDRVLNGQPFGNGVDGAYSSATIPTLTKDSCSGTATSTALTTTGSTFANGDILLIHQTRGTGVGQWEINKVASGGGSTSLTLQVALNYTYTDSGASQTQAVKIPQYTDCTVQSGTWTVPGWDGNVGGIAPFAVKGTMTVTGTISTNGVGFGGGNYSTGQATSGEGTVGAQTGQESPNGNGGGGGTVANGQWGGGGGGGNGAAGIRGSGNEATGWGQGGLAVGTADLLTFDIGGGGGGPFVVSGTGGVGGSGAGGTIIFAKAITITGGMAHAGSNGTKDQNGGGGGAGGSCLIVCQTAILGSNLITTTGGNGGGKGDGERYGGDGGTGRIAVHHSGTVTGTTNPTFTDVTDTSLVESGGGAFFAFF